MKSIYEKLNFIVLCVFILSSFQIFCQSEDSIQPTSNDDELAAAIQNPVASLVSIPFQNNLDFNDRNTNTLNIQPVFPFNLGEKVSLVARTIIPVVSASLYSESSPNAKIKGIGNISSALFLTPAKPGKLIWAVGPTLTFGTVTQGVGTNKFSIAPSGLLLYQNSGLTIGTIIQNSWSVAGPSDAADVNLFYSQIFIVKNLKKGWYVNTAPIITANWEADSSHRWTVPLGAGFGKLSKINKLPVNWQVGYYGYIEHPTGAKSQLRFQVVFILPKLY